MGRREELDALADLRKLLGSDLTKQSEEAIVAGIREAELAFARSQAWSGLLIDELKRRGLSLSAIVRLTGMKQTTIHRRALQSRETNPSSTTSSETG